ncbi:AAA family ATPase [bacterium]|nr:AAA family ATPase [bacterium]
MRENLVALMRAGETLFPGIIGFERTVLPQIENAILARHNFILLGLRGQAKTRLLRLLSRFLDEALPVVAGSEINDDPFAPVSRYARRLVEERGPETPIEWLPREQRYVEKLATPDVNVADLIGDVDPMKVMSRKLSLSDEDAIHFGLVPRANRGIFAINELPDLSARIQVALLNILEERDIQIRGFPVRLPLDIVLVFTANPEDYTNRGSIITPLKDRIEAQILTHYPQSLEDSVRITDQEAWIDRGAGRAIVVPDYIRQSLERVAFEARASDYIDQQSGVSARMTIALLETLYSNVERRMFRAGEERAVARISDLFSSASAITGKVELVFKGEQEGVSNVAQALIGSAVRTTFNHVFIPNFRPGSRQKPEREIFAETVAWFEEGRHVDIYDDMAESEYAGALARIPGLKKTTSEYMKPPREQLPAAMGFVLEGLVQHFMIGKKVLGQMTIYRDALRDNWEEMTD